MDIVLLALIGANVLISYQGFSDYSFFRKFQFHIGGIRSGEQIRMISSGFLHADWGHLAVNMLSLYLFAPIVIQNFGAFYFLVFYAISLIMGNMLSLYIHKNNYNYSAVGASGAVTGIVYASILIYPEMEFYGFIPAYIFGVLYLFYSIYGMKSKMDNIGHTAHFGGAVGGYIITIAKAPYLLEQNLKYVMFLAVPIIILFVLTKKGKL